MNPADQRRWKTKLLDEILQAFAADSDLRGKLIFKGARILNLRLGQELRQSLDIDTNLDFTFQQSHPDPQDRKTILEATIRSALSRYFNRQEPVRYTVEQVEATPKPSGPHLFGWDGFVRTFTILCVPGMATSSPTPWRHASSARIMAHTR